MENLLDSLYTWRDRIRAAGLLDRNEPVP